MPLSKREALRIAVLQRRIDFLSMALDDWKGGDTGRAKAEHDALRWAIGEIKAYHQALDIQIEEAEMGRGTT